MLPPPHRQLDVQSSASIRPLLVLALGMFGASAQASEAARSDVAAGARVEVQAGRSPRTGLGDSEAAFISELALGGGFRRASRRDQTTLRYRPRLWYRPEIVSPERPLVFHQLSLSHGVDVTRRSRLDFSLDSNLGELAYGGGQDSTLGATFAGLDTTTFSVFSLAGSAGWQHRLNRVTTITTLGRSGYRTATTVPVLPGLRVQEGRAPIPESVDGSVSVTTRRRASRQLTWVVPVSMGLYWSDVVGTLGSTSVQAGSEVALSRQTGLEAAAGATYIAVPGQERTTTLPVFPVARVALNTALHESDARTWTLGVTARHAGKFDTLQGDYRPSVAVTGTTSYREEDVTVALDVQASVITSEDLYPNEARSYYRANLPVTIRLADHLDLVFGGRFFGRAPEFPTGSFFLEQIQLLGFVALSVSTGTGADARWAL